MSASRSLRAHQLTFADLGGSTICYGQTWARKSHRGSAVRFVTDSAVRFVTAKRGPERPTKTRQYDLLRPQKTCKERVAQEGRHLVSCSLFRSMSQLCGPGKPAGRKQVRAFFRLAAGADWLRVHVPFVRDNWPLKSILREKEADRLCGGSRLAGTLQRRSERAVFVVVTEAISPWVARWPSRCLRPCVSLSARFQEQQGQGAQQDTGRAQQQCS